MKKATYKIEFKVKNDFRAGDCWSCPYSYIDEYDDSQLCHLQFDIFHCKLEVNPIGNKEKE